MINLIMNMNKYLIKSFLSVSLKKFLYKFLAVINGICLLI